MNFDRRTGDNWRGYYLTAYGVAVKHGFTGTEEEWLESLKGEKGEPFVWNGYYDTYGEMIAEHPTGTDPEAYLVGMDLYVWDPEKQSWKNNGSVKGPPGERGEKGDTGEQGPQGIQGRQGETGPKGDQGPQGDPGPKGDTGADGAPGESAGFGTISASVDNTTGNPSVEVQTSGPNTGKNITFLFKGIKGEAGEIGPQGAEGPAGPQGVQGPPGEKGDTGTGLDIRGTYDSLEALRSGVPAPNQGDIYNVGAVAPFTIYMWDTTNPPGDWISQGQLQGPIGPEGPQGPEGPAGPQGEQGPVGETGPQGPEGPAGPQGPEGPAGPQGPQGEQARVINDLTTGGVDAALSAEQGKVLGAALSNKAEKFPILNISPDTSTPSDYPQGLSIVNGDYGIYVTVQGQNAWRTLQLYGVQDGVMYYRVNAGNDPVSWSQLLKIAAATPPQEYNLPLESGLSAPNPCTYRINQFNEVSVAGTVSGTITYGTTIGILPEGFRPAQNIERQAIYYVNGVWVSGTVSIIADGTILGYSVDSATQMVFSADFVAVG